jgi:class 3 adenylate cyclase/TolB-like protein
MQRRLAAILVADVVGYSRLMGRDEGRTLAALKAHRRELIDPEIAGRDGRIVSSKGDGILAEFASVVAAVECAVALQQGMSARNKDLPADERLEFRIGINLDEVIEDGGDIFGDGVNVAARLEAFADPGTICVSGAAFGQVKNRVEHRFEDLGPQRLKNIAEPVRVYRLDPNGVAVAGLAASAAPPVAEKPSIAVLPFANLSGDPAQAYLADGLRLDIQAALVHASGLFLIAPAAVARYRDQPLPVEQVAREMGVRYVLAGAVRRSGAQLRVTAELTDAAARRIVWAERYDRRLEDGFAVQDEIVLEVLKALDVQLASGERWLLHSSVKSLEGLDLFYRGLAHFYAGTRDDNVRAREAFEKLTRLQPESPIGHAYLCFTYWRDAFNGWAPSKKHALAEAALWARKAASLEGHNGLAHIVLATTHLLRQRHDAALEECRRAVKRRPNCPTAYGYLANVLHYCGHAEEAIATIERAMRISPVYPPWYLAVLAAAYRDAGAIGKSIAAAERGVALAPLDRDLRLILCADYSLVGEVARARALAEEVTAAEPQFSIGAYLDGQPYRDPATKSRIAGALRDAGLPA